MMNEINRVRNIAYNNNQIGRENLRRSWKGLRKFYTPGQLERAALEPYPQHLERPWAQLDRPDRPDPIVPRLPENRDICSVDRYYTIVVHKAYSDGDAHLAQDPTSWSLSQPRRRSPTAPLDSSRDVVSFPAHQSPRHQPRRRRDASPQASKAAS